MSKYITRKITKIEKISICIEHMLKTFDPNNHNEIEFIKINIKALMKKISKLKQTIEK